MLRLAITLLAIALLLGACSPPESDSASSDPASSTPAAAATEAASAAEPTSSAAVEPTSSPTAPEPTSEASAGQPVPEADAATVAGVVDGDTIDVVVGGREVRVRLILVDTPEVFGGAECYGAEASAFTKQLLPAGTPVRLERDVSETDRFGRLLRYVYLEDGRMVNELLVAEGYAQVATFPPDVKYEERLLAAQREAREAGRGLWGACVDGGDTGSPAPPSGDCDPSYPDVCIPPPPPDLDCGDVQHRRFRVLSPDPHNFDANGDGVGCES